MHLKCTCVNVCTCSCGSGCSCLCGYFYVNMHIICVCQWAIWNICTAETSLTYHLILFLLLFVFSGSKSLSSKFCRIMHNYCFSFSLKGLQILLFPKQTLLNIECANFPGAHCMQYSRVTNREFNPLQLELSIVPATVWCWVPNLNLLQK